MRARFARATYARKALRRVHVSLFTTLCFGVSAPSTGLAGEPPVAVGEVSASTPSGEFSIPLRSALNEGIASLSVATPRDRFVLSATLLHLDAVEVGRGARASAEVSLVLRRARQQTLYAVIKGHATAEAAESSLGETRDDALRAAVRSALRRLPEALR
jgi:hypothetical protein